MLTLKKIFKNKEFKKAITNATIFISIGTLLTFGVLVKHKDIFEPVRAEAEIAFEDIKISEKTEIRDIPKKQNQDGFYFYNTPLSDSPLDFIIFDAEMKRASVKAQEMLGRDASLEEIKEVKKIYEYMLEMKPNGDRSTLMELSAAAVKYSRKYSVPIGLVVGVMQTESFFNPKALSKAGAAGPMQVMWNIHNGLLRANGISERDQLFTTDLGTAAGCLILARYLRDEKSVAGGLKRYYGALSGNYISTTYANWHTFELYSSGLLEGSSKNALARDRNYLSSLMNKSVKSTASASKTTTAKDAKTEGTIVIKKQNGSTIVWKAK